MITHLLAYPSSLITQAHCLLSGLGMRNPYLLMVTAHHWPRLARGKRELPHGFLSCIGEARPSWQTALFTTFAGGMTDSTPDPSLHPIPVPPLDDSLFVRPHPQAPMLVTNGLPAVGGYPSCYSTVPGTSTGDAPNELHGLPVLGHQHMPPLIPTHPLLLENSIYQPGLST
jgi:hypothetical protein